MDSADLHLALQCAQALPGWVYPALAPIAASVIDMVVKQPAAGSLWLLIRKPISLLAGNLFFAKNADQETLPEWWVANRQALAAWLVKAAGDALQAEIVKAASPPAQILAPAAAEAPAPPQEGQ